MTKLYDATKIATIAMKTFDNTTSTMSPDFSADFFEVGSLHYSEELDAYEVQDVEYCIEQANDWANAEGDFASEEHNMETAEPVVDAVVEDR